MLLSVYNGPTGPEQVSPANLVTLLVQITPSWIFQQDQGLLGQGKKG